MLRTESRFTSRYSACLCLPVKEVVRWSIILRWYGPHGSWKLQQKCNGVKKRGGDEIGWQQAWTIIYHLSLLKKVQWRVRGWWTRVYEWGFYVFILWIGMGMSGYHYSALNEQNCAGWLTKRFIFAPLPLFNFAYSKTKQIIYLMIVFILRELQIIFHIKRMECIYFWDRLVPKVIDFVI